MTVGDGLLEATDMGPVAGPQQYEDIRSAIGRAQADGARMIAGGDANVPADGYFIRPTVFTDVKPEMEIFRDEIFGPVLAVCEFESLDEALEMANNSIYGLSSAIFTATSGGEEVHRRHRSRPGARQYPHRLQGTVDAVRRRQAVGRRPA